MIEFCSYDNDKVIIRLSELEIVDEYFNLGFQGFF